MIKKFLGLVSSHNVPVYLIDPLVLGLIHIDFEQLSSSSDGKSPECKYFCAPRDFTTFALLDKTWKHEVRFSPFSLLSAMMRPAIIGLMVEQNTSI